MTIWYTADQHFGHTRIIELADRPFSSVTEMNETMIRRWNERVHPLDLVYVLGDFALGHLDTTLAYTRRLMGRKVLVAGNHDRCFPGFRKPGGGRDHEQWVQHYLDVGFEGVHTNGEVEIDEHLGWVNLNHFPYVGDSHDADRFEDFRPPLEDDGPALLLHGHVHTAWKYRDDPAPMVNVGVDVWDFAPVSGNQIDAFLDAQ